MFEQLLKNLDIEPLQRIRPFPQPINPTGQTRKKEIQTKTVSKVEPYYSINEAAKILNIPRRWIDDAINSRQLTYYQPGVKARKIKLSDVNAFIEKSKCNI